MTKLRFTSELYRKIRLGQKTETRRPFPDARMQERFLYATDDERGSVVEVTGVTVAHIKDITDDDALSEGFSSREDFIAEWKLIYPDTWYENIFVVVYRFNKL